MVFQISLFQLIFTDFSTSGSWRISKLEKTVLWCPQESSLRRDKTFKLAFIWKCFETLLWWKAKTISKTQKLIFTFVTLGLNFHNRNRQNLWNLTVIRQSDHPIETLWIEFHISHHVRKFGYREIFACRIWNESRKILLVASVIQTRPQDFSLEEMRKALGTTLFVILGFVIRNTAGGIWNPCND